MKKTSNTERPTFNAEFGKAARFDVRRSTFGVRRFLCDRQ
jgi:hypothetical protein